METDHQGREHRQQGGHRRQREECPSARSTARQTRRSADHYDNHITDAALETRIQIR